MDNDSLASARLGEGMIRAGSIQPLSGLVKAFGLDEAALLRAVGLPRGALARADNVLPLDRSARLIELCAQRSGRPDLALLIGQRIEPEQYGLIGAQMRHARSVGAAWRGLVLTLHLNDRVTVPSISVRDGEARLSFAYYGEDIDGTYHAADFALAAACVAMRTLCGPQWAPTSNRSSG